MYPQQNTGQYDFIVNPQKPKRGLPLPGWLGSPFAKKIIIIFGIALVLFIGLWILGSALNSNKLSANDAIQIVQAQEEISRVAALGSEATTAETRNVAATVAITLQSQQQSWLSYLSGQGEEPKDNVLSGLKNEETDTKLEESKANNTFDQTFVDVLEEQLTVYSSLLNTTFSKASGSNNIEPQRLITSDYTQTQELLKQLEAL